MFLNPYYLPLLTVMYFHDRKHRSFVDQLKFFLLNLNTHLLEISRFVYSTLQSFRLYDLKLQIEKKSLNYKIPKRVIESKTHTF